MNKLVPDIIKKVEYWIMPEYTYTDVVQAKFFAVNNDLAHRVNSSIRSVDMETFVCDYEFANELLSMWQLDKPLHEQSEKCLKFIDKEL